jgi:hypothetical protein
MEALLTHLGFCSMEEVTTPSLRNAFKRYAALAHPDKGGSEQDFENVLSAYLHLSSILRRQTGGRDGQAVLYAKDVREARESQFIHELNNMVNEVYDGIDKKDTIAFQKEFNEAFERLHVTDLNGYDEWYRANTEDIGGLSEESKIDSMDDFHKKFEETVKQGKPAPTTLALHLNEMVFFGSRIHGTSLLPTENKFHSDPSTNPTYTDLYAAYTTEHTITDKLPEFVPRTLEEMMKERERANEPLQNMELEAIDAYEKKKEQEEKQHREKIEEYFRSAASSQWALHGDKLHPI